MLGDQWLLGYLHLPGSAAPVPLFSVGHAVELYLKAVFLKHDPKLDVRKKGHRIDKMLSEIRVSHPPLLASYELRDSAYAKFNLSSPLPISAVVDPDYEHFIRHQELYWVARHLADIKYLGTIHNNLSPNFAVACMPANPYWANFFREIREHLGWPEVGMWADHIGAAAGALPSQAIPFLRALQL